MSELKRKLAEVEATATAAEEEIVRLQTSSKLARKEAERLQRELEIETERQEYAAELQKLRAFVAEIKREIVVDPHGRVLRLALLFDRTLRGVADVDKLVFTLPIGWPDEDPHAYYDDGDEPLSVDEAKDKLYVKATWRWDDVRDRVAKIFHDGRVEVVGHNDEDPKEEVSYNLLTDDPEVWIRFLCNGKPEQ